MRASSFSSTRITRMHETLDALDKAAEAADGRAMLNTLHALLHDVERIGFIANLLLEKQQAA